MAQVGGYVRAIVAAGKYLAIHTADNSHEIRVANDNSSFDTIKQMALSAAQTSAKLTAEVDSGGYINGIATVTYNVPGLP